MPTPNKNEGAEVRTRIPGKRHFLRSSQAKDCVKDKITGCYLVQEEKPTPKTETKTKRHKTKQENKSVKSQEEKPKLTKTERRARYNELKRELKQVWSTEMESEGENQDNMSVPSHFKRYTIQDRKVIVQQPKRTLEEPGKSYDGPENAVGRFLPMEIRLAGVGF